MSHPTPYWADDGVFDWRGCSYSWEFDYLWGCLKYSHMFSVHYTHKLYVQSPVVPTFFEGICFLWSVAIDVSNIHLAPL